MSRPKRLRVLTDNREGNRHGTGPFVVWFVNTTDLTALWSDTTSSASATRMLAWKIRFAGILNSRDEFPDGGVASSL
ncbi:MAG: hypothetical protein AB8G99_23580 [Planctomycetaceae bacterium]